MGKPLHVLIVEDSDDDFFLLLRELQRSGYEVESERVETAEAMRSALAGATWDLIISDYSLPEFNAPHALEVLKASGIDLPFILISGTIGEEAAAAAMMAGANDFLIKGKYARLEPAIERELREAESRRQRRLAEAATAAFQKRFQSLIEYAPDGIALLGIDGRLRQVTPSTEQILGYTLEEVEGQDPAALIHPDDLPGVMALLNDLLQNPEKIIHTHQYRFKHKNSSWRWLESTISNLLAEPSVEAIVFNYRDVTARRQAEESLLASEVRYRRLFEAAKDGILILNAETGEIVDVNPFLIELLGYDHREILGRQLWEIGLLKDIVANKEAFLKLQEQSYIRYENLPLKTKEGRGIWVEFVSNTYTVDGWRVIQCNIRDITERKKAQELIQQQLKRLNGLRAIDIAISSSFDIHSILDILLQQALSLLEADAADVLLFNPALQTLEYTARRGFRSTAIHLGNVKLGDGYAGRAMLERRVIHIPNLIEAGGKLAETLLSAGENLVDYYCAPLIVKSEAKGVLEIYHHAALETNRSWLDFLEALAGQAAIAIDNAQLFDSLQRSNAELEQRVAQRTAELNQTNVKLEHANRAKDEFLANMSHELRTPLNSILGLSETLLEQRRDPLSEYQQRSLRIVESSGTHLLELINDILDLSKIEAGRFDYYPQIIVVDELCRASLSLIREQATRKSITVTYLKETPIVKIYADLRRLKQILVNLLTNAVKFTPQNGRIILEVRADVEQDRVQFSVIDSGIGISPENLQQLFVPFKQIDSSLTREYEGTGLGLALVKELTDLHGGSVDVESEVGRGSRFRVNLPLMQEQLTKQEIVDAGGKPLSSEPASQTNIPIHDTPVGRKLILLAEDNLANVLTIGDYLESHGYQVVVAHDGLEAFGIATESTPDLILTDIQMPVLNGLDLIRRLRADTIFDRIPIIALTALAMPGDRERCLEAGANEYLSKPVSLKNLVKTIDSFIHQNE